MPVIPDLDLTSVSIRCSKHKCRTGDYVLHRHHKRHEFIWLRVWEWRIEQPRFVELVRRYYEYRPDDVVPICSAHHREIHEIYDSIITQHKAWRGVPLERYTWTEALDLMSKLEARCKRWLKQVTPGSAPWPSNGMTKHSMKQAEDYFAAVRGEVPF